MTNVPMRALAMLVAAGTRLLGQGSAPITRDSLQRVLEDRVQGGRSAGLVVGVVGPDTRYTVAAGSERPDRPLDEHSIFEIGSITKVFTGILLAEMAERGEVRLEQPVAELLPAGTRVPSRGGMPITLGHLATQTSGLPRLPDNLRPANPANPYADYGVEQLHDFLSRHELRRDPGAQYEYSNLGAGLLGHALAVRAGRSYEDLVRERILAPLGMAASGIALTPAMRARAVDGRTADGEVVPWWDMPTLAGAGALRSSLHDMMRFLEANLQPPDSPLGRAITLSHGPRFRVNAALSVGLHWHRSTFRGDTLVWHNGGTGGFRTILAWNPATRTGAVLLGSSSQDNEDIVRHVLLGTPLLAQRVRTEIAMPAADLQPYAGVYDFTPQFAITVALRDGVLVAQATDQPALRIYAEARDRFFYRAVEAELHFQRDAAGNVVSVTLVQGGARVIGRRR